MDVVYELDGATAAEIRARLPHPPSYSAVRALLARLEAKGYLKHSQDGPRYVYQALVPRQDACRRALHRLVKVFFRSEEHTSELQSRENLVCRLLLEKKNPHRLTSVAP